MHSVFISHSTADRGFVDDNVVPLLKKHGFSPWYCYDNIRPSQQLNSAILDGLRSTDWFMVILSREAAASAWVSAELAWALVHRVGRVVPVIVDDCDLLDFDIRIALIKHVDGRPPNPFPTSDLLLAFSDPPEPPQLTNVQDELSPMVVRSPRMQFHCGPWVPADCFVGREEELIDARHLINSRRSFLIIGEPRAGKTSICHKLRQEIEEDIGSNLLTSYFNLQQCSELTLETFLEHTILNIVGEISRKVFGCRYTDLKHPRSLESQSHLHDDNDFRSFFSTFKVIRRHTHEQQGSRRRRLSQRLFIDLTSELLQIAANKGRSRVVIFYDEANRLPLDISAHLLISIGESLSETGVAGAYVASPEMEDHFEAVGQLFGGRLLVGPFRSHNEMKTLLARYYFDDVAKVEDLPLSDESFAVLWSCSGGTPFLIQLIADRSFRIARSQKSNKVTPNHVTEAHLTLRKERPSAFLR